MITQQMAKYLAAQGVGTYGETNTSAVENIFLNNMPASPDSAIALYDVPGQGSDVPKDVSLDKPAVRIVVRGDGNPITAAVLAETVKTKLHGLHQMTFVSGGVNIMLCAVGSPYSFGKDGNGRYQYGLNVSLITGGGR